jgi:hypothetical protein
MTDILRAPEDQKKRKIKRNRTQTKHLLDGCNSNSKTMVKRQDQVKKIHETAMNLLMLAIRRLISD